VESRHLVTAANWFVGLSTTLKCFENNESLETNRN
jgi:hypothetical protein